MFTAVHLDGVKAGVAGLPGDGGSIGTVAGALSDEAGAERMPAQLRESGGVEAGVFGAATDGLMYRGPGQRSFAKVAVLRDCPEQR